MNTVLAPHVIEDIRELIGNTPLLRLKHFPLPAGVRVYAKLEYLNPGGSIKDRIGLVMLAEAERQGLLRPGGTIIEPTAGNTGIGLALAAINRGYRVIFTVPAKFSEEKQELMRALGAEIVNTPTAESMEGAIAKAKELAAAIPGAYIPNQFANASNPLAHYRTTGPELWRDLAGKVDVFVAGVGSGGTFTGATRYLKEQNPAVRAVAVEPVGSTLGGGPPGSHRTEGIGVDDWIPETLATSLIDQVVTVPDDDAFDMVKTLAQREGLLVGSSSGAAVWAALAVAHQLDGPANIAVILPDRSDRYFSQNIYQGGK